MAAERRGVGVPDGALCGLLVWIQMGCSRSKADVCAQPPVSGGEPAGPERVLIRISNKVDVTQADVERLLRSMPVERRRYAAHDAVWTVLNNKTFLLYIQEHPDLVTEQDVRKKSRPTSSLPKSSPPRT